MKNRPGFTLPDILVSLVVMGVIGAALAQVMIVQSQFYSKHEGRSQARAVSRSATNLMLSELRMVEPTGGLIAVSSTSITLRVPYAMGMVCENAGGILTVAMMRLDTDARAEATPGNSGYAWRATDGTYHYVLGKVTTGSGTCPTGTGSIAPDPQGYVITIPNPPSGPIAGTPLFLYQRINYAFSTSVSVPGRIGLWRTALDRTSGAPEEVVAPFDNSAAFRFYVDGSNTPQPSPPVPLSGLRGLELNLISINERAANNNLEELAPYTTSVFFKNRP